ncbi:MAG: hypothetical protein WBZ36_29135 [Candidatus Nitrosopolaris sp.]
MPNRTDGKKVGFASIHKRNVLASHENPPYSYSAVDDITLLQSNRILTI